MDRRERRSRQELDYLTENDRILETETGSAWLQSEESWLWKCLCTCRYTDCGTNDDVDD